MVEGAAELVAGMVEPHLVAPPVAAGVFPAAEAEAAEPEALTFWDAQNDGWANAETRSCSVTSRLRSPTKRLLESRTALDVEVDMLGARVSEWTIRGRVRASD